MLVQNGASLGRGNVSLSEQNSHGILTMLRRAIMFLFGMLDAELRDLPTPQLNDGSDILGMETEQDVLEWEGEPVPDRQVQLLLIFKYLADIMTYYLPLIFRIYVVR